MASPIIGIVTIILVPCVVLICFKVRGYSWAAAFRRSTGLISVFLGASITVWVVFNLFAPTEAFRRSNVSVVQFAVPIALVWFGWRMLTGRRT